MDRIAVIAALNLANELLRAQTQDRRAEAEVTGRVRALRERVDGALVRGQQLDL
jgi:cell division protein ZapA (FtsZ GTPase activity inhibitor)